MRFGTWTSALVAITAACSPSHPPAAGADAGAGAEELDLTCKTTPGATPIVTLGWGQSDYLPLTELQTLDVEAGPQGGHHIWLAVRMKNLLGSGSRTTLEAVSPATGTVISPFDVIFTYEPAEGAYCKLPGLRYQLDADGVDYLPLLGKELDVTATVVDRSGDTAKDSRRVMLSVAVR